jgi:hypothetical protein
LYTEKGKMQNGKVKKTVVNTMPGTAKMILTSCASSHGLSQPCNPKIKT